MRIEEYITPNCCQKATTTKAVRLGLYPIENDDQRTWKDAIPKWYIIGDELKWGKHWQRKVEIDKCPFCDQKLPEVELRNEDIKIADGDEEYCDTCGERHMCCDCYPPEYRWKPNK